MTPSIPSRFKPQRQIVEADLPTGGESLDLMEMALVRMADAGYVYIGMDHFALPDDELAVAQREGRLRRDFQGYTARRPGDLISFGVSDWIRAPTLMNIVWPLATKALKLWLGTRKIWTLPLRRPAALKIGLA